VAPPAELNEEDDAAEATNDNDEAVEQPKPAKKTLRAMRQLAMFYNPMATNYVQDAIQSRQAINWEGKEQMRPTQILKPIRTRAQKHMA